MLFSAALNENYYSVRWVYFIFFSYFLWSHREIPNCHNFIQFHNNSTSFTLFASLLLFQLSTFPVIFSSFFLFFTFCLVKDQFHNSKLKVNNVIFLLGYDFQKKIHICLNCDALCGWILYVFNFAEWS